MSLLVGPDSIALSSCFPKPGLPTGPFLPQRLSKGDSHGLYKAPWDSSTLGVWGHWPKSHIEG